MEQRSAYCVRADKGRYASAFRDGSYAAIGWQEVGDLSALDEDDMDALGRLYDEAYPEDSFAKRRMNLSQIRNFLWSASEGDVIVTPTEDSKELMVGVVGGLYRYEEAPSDCPYPHRKDVRWLDGTVARSTLSVPVQQSLKAPPTVFGVRPPDELLAVAGIEVPEASPVREAEASLSETVIERLLELDADEFEILVAEVLRAIGFEAEKVGRSGDGGVDVEGTLDVYGLASVDLKVQVKRYRVGNLVDHNAVKSFRASVPERSQAALITTSTFTKKAREEEAKEGFKRIGLVDGEQFVEILTEEYERLSDGVRDRIGVRRVLAPS